ncbi:CRAL-TRIO domain-containing protein [Chloropicon primus]|uniref:CRAL-TRIO domain-containing protein n=1 Tax=Chloropicon primus TaxID=1764295 RepID=A0A5B8MJF1_9CHLO|nr:hypothetical protein A3770_04p32560 [Chloropicon primus]UPQ99950.1 CRAL-TRIO domain-containing protein [Chloropicon primus]|eukprot:QDZ20738.1 hypothetical protein A3770_04p32560 [Chloropicon primus]
MVPAGSEDQEEAKVRELRERLRALGREVSCCLERCGCHPETQKVGELLPELEELEGDTLKRFLVARKWNVAKAEAMYANFVEYRLRVPEGCIEEKDCSVGLRHRKTFLVPKVDRGGNSVFMTIMRRHIVSECPPGEPFKYTQFSFDKITQHLRRRGIQQAVFVFDFSGFGWENLDASTAAQILKQAQDYNPERLHKAILYNCPLLFWVLWKVITPLMDARMRSKFKFCYSSDDLEEHFHMEHVPVGMGGESEEEDWVPIERVT